MDSPSPSVSFIGIVDFTEDARWVYCSESVHDLLGFEPHELIGTPSLDLVHPDEFPQVRAIHYSTITQDQAAVLVYLRLRHKDPCKGYILCAISRTVCQGVLVGSVSFASPGPKAMHNASTAQEVTIITPTAKDFEFRRWGDPNPMPPCAVPANLIPPDAPPSLAPLRFAPLPEQSVRTALILDRFSVRCGVLYVSNDSILRTTRVLGRAFFDFVVRRDEELVRSWIDVVKGWGVNERGQPSDGGFGFGKFTLLLDGRDSRVPSEQSKPPARRQGAPAHRGRNRAQSTGARHAPPPPPHARAAEAQLVVDAIFSAHSDGLMVILRPADARARTANAGAGLNINTSGAGVRTSPGVGTSPQSSTSPQSGASSHGTVSPQSGTSPQSGASPHSSTSPYATSPHATTSPHGGTSPAHLRQMQMPRTSPGRDALSGMTRDSLTLPPIRTREEREREGRPPSSSSPFASASGGYAR